MSSTPDSVVVWAEIPVTDLDRAMTFYGSVLKTQLKKQEDGPNPIAMFVAEDSDAVAGHLYPGTPAGDGRGPTIHLAVPDDLEATADRVRQAGGTILSDPIEIPAGRFIYGQDPDGNSIGLFAFAR